MQIKYHVLCTIYKRGSGGGRERVGVVECMPKIKSNQWNTDFRLSTISRKTTTQIENDRGKGGGGSETP